MVRLRGLGNLCRGLFRMLRQDGLQLVLRLEQAVRHALQRAVLAADLVGQELRLVDHHLTVRQDVASMLARGKQDGRHAARLSQAAEHDRCRTRLDDVVDHHARLDIPAGRIDAEHDGGIVVHLRQIHHLLREGAGLLHRDRLFQVQDALLAQQPLDIHLVHPARTPNDRPHGNPLTFLTVQPTIGKSAPRTISPHTL